MEQNEMGMEQNEIGMEQNERHGRASRNQTKSVDGTALKSGEMMGEKCEIPLKSLERQ